MATKKKVVKKKRVQKTQPTKKRAAKKDNGKATGSFSELWNRRRKEVKPTSFEDTKVDPGNYICELTTARGGEDKNGHPFLAINLAVQGGEFDGGKLSIYFATHRQGKPDNQAVDRLINALQNLNFSAEDLDAENLAAELEEIGQNLSEEEIAVKVSVTHRDQYQNVFLNGIT